MRRADIFRMLGSRAEQENNLAVVVFINVCKAHAFAVRSKGEMVVGHQQFAVRRPIRPAVEFHLVAEGRRKVFDDALLGHDTHSARLLRRREGFAQSDLHGLFHGLGDRLLPGDLDVTDQSDRVIQHVVISLWGKGLIRYDAVPVFRLVLGESAAPDLGMIREHRLHVRFVQFDQGNHRPLVGLVHVGEADALTRGRKGKVIVGQKQLPVRRPVRPAVEFKRIAVFLGKISDDALFGDQSFRAGRSRDSNALGQRTLLRGEDDGNGARLFEFVHLVLQFADLVLKFDDLLVFLAEFITIRTVLLRRFLSSLDPLGKDRQATQTEGAQQQHHAQNRVHGDQCADAHRQNVTHRKLCHCFHPPQSPYCLADPSFCGAFRSFFSFFSIFSTNTTSITKMTSTTPPSTASGIQFRRIVMTAVMGSDAS